MEIKRQFEKKVSFSTIDESYYSFKGGIEMLTPPFVSGIMGGGSLLTITRVSNLHASKTIFKSSSNSNIFSHSVYFNYIVKLELQDYPQRMILQRPTQNSKNMDNFSLLPLTCRVSYET